MPSPRPALLIPRRASLFCALPLLLLLGSSAAADDPESRVIEADSTVVGEDFSGDPSAPAAPSPTAAPTAPVADADEGGAGVPLWDAEAAWEWMQQRDGEPGYEYVLRMLTGLLFFLPVHWRLDILQHALWWLVEGFLALLVLAGLGFRRGRVHDYDVATFRGRDPRRWIIAGMQELADWAHLRQRPTAAADEETITLRREVADLRADLATQAKMIGVLTHRLGSQKQHEENVAALRRWLEG